ncbi:MAG: helix-turn-helix domain-containing protein, partial [Clostridiales bacterium]|nr:helix-turn-helix domain-containing protein [Clostridiales bacterium]
MKNNFKEMILELRKEKGLNQREIAKKIDEKQSSYCRWENGNSIPNIETLIKIAEFYETSTDYIL